MSIFLNLIYRDICLEIVKRIEFILAMHSLPSDIQHDFNKAIHSLKVRCETKAR